MSGHSQHQTPRTAGNLHQTLLILILYSLGTGHPFSFFEKKIRCRKAICLYKRITWYLPLQFLINILLTKCWLPRVVRGFKFSIQDQICPWILILINMLVIAWNIKIIQKLCDGKMYHNKLGLSYSVQLAFGFFLSWEIFFFKFGFGLVWFICMPSFNLLLCLELVKK